MPPPLPPPGRAGGARAAGLPALPRRGPQRQGLLHPLTPCAPRPGDWKGKNVLVFTLPSHPPRPPARPRYLPRFTKLMTISASLRKALSCALVSGDAPPPGPVARRLPLPRGCAAPGDGDRGWDAPAPPRGPGCRLSSSEAPSSSSSADRALYRSSMKRGADFSRPGGGSPRAGCCCGNTGGCGRPCRGRGRCGSPSTDRISLCISRFSCVLSRRYRKPEEEVCGGGGRSAWPGLPPSPSNAPPAAAAAAGRGGGPQKLHNSPHHQHSHCAVRPSIPAGPGGPRGPREAWSGGARPERGRGGPWREQLPPPPLGGLASPSRPQSLSLMVLWGAPSCPDWKGGGGGAIPAAEPLEGQGETPHPRGGLRRRKVQARCVRVRAALQRASSPPGGSGGSYSRVWLRAHSPPGAAHQRRGMPGIAPAHACASLARPP